MKTAVVVGCGAYMDKAYACPGDWRCFKAAAKGEGKFDEPTAILAFIRCECPGRAVAPTVGAAVKMLEEKPDAVKLASCLVNAKPACPYFQPEELAAIIQEKTGVPVELGTHTYK